jgi:hypothetical protein
MKPMFYQQLHRQAVAILAAYAVALQALLIAFAPPLQPASSGLLTVICSSVGLADGGKPTSLPGHDPNCMMCGSSGCAVPPPADSSLGVLVTAALGSYAVRGAQSDFAESEPARTRPQSPRAPPRAA